MNTWWFWWVRRVESVEKRSGETDQRAGLHRAVPQTAVAAGGPERTRLLQVHLRTDGRTPALVRSSPTCVCWTCTPGRYLVEPEVVRLQKPLEFGEKLVVVKVIDGLHVARAVVQITCDLWDGQNGQLPARTCT